MMPFVGESTALASLMEEAGRLAVVNRPVLILGERGSGKELVASRIHYLSPRWEGPLITLNCGTLSPELMASELFGHERGAFTGATTEKPGRFERARHGSLFLDEITTSSPTMQEQLLRVLETGQFERVGGQKTLSTDARVIAATNENPKALAAEGKFRDDLLDRLAFAVIRVPPLRERKEDIPALSYHFAHRLLTEMDSEYSPEFSEEAMEVLMGYDWPGNIRELKNVVERAVFMGEGGIVEDIELDPFEKFEAKKEVADTPADSPEPKPLPWPRDLNLELENLRQTWTEEALTRNEGHQGKAADDLGLAYHQFRALLRRLKKNAGDTSPQD